MDFRGGLGEGFRVKLLRRIDGELRVLAFRLMNRQISSSREPVTILRDPHGARSRLFVLRKQSIAKKHIKNDTECLG